jgi:mono/diheme cytochrome c family protein
MTRIRFTRLLALAAITSLTFVTSEAFAQQKEGAPPGKGSFVRYCAECHGADAKGDGPKAAALDPKPADLTLLSKNSGGSFPSARVTGILDGSQPIAAHGSAKQPVWGHPFGAGEQAAGGNPGGANQGVGRQRIQLIEQYLESVQEK